MKSITHLELQHVSTVVTDLNTKRVHVRGPRAAAAPVPHVPIDIKSYA